MVTTFRRKQNRLSLPNYTDTHAYLLTLAAEKRRREFNDALVTFCLEKLSAIAIKHKVSVLAYCFIARPPASTGKCGEPKLCSCVRTGLQTDHGLHLQERTGRTLWQKSYHDHILRSEESARRAAQYIAANPVRAGIVASPVECPYTGSFVWERSVVVEG